MRAGAESRLLTVSTATATSTSTATEVVTGPEVSPSTAISGKSPTRQRSEVGSVYESLVVMHRASLIAAPFRPLRPTPAAKRSRGRFFTREVLVTHNRGATRSVATASPVDAATTAALISHRATTSGQLA